MILTVCPNPCLDCTIELDNLNVGRLNRIDNKIVNYAGKALNVAVGIARLGSPVTASGFMFEDEGKIFEQKLLKEGVVPDFVWNNGNVRVNYKIIDKNFMLTEINDRGENISIDKQEELISKVANLSKKAEIVVMSGSLPSGVDKTFYREIFSVIPKNVVKVCDTEKENMVEALKCGLTLIKPNLRELEDMVGKKLRTRKDILQAANTMIDKGTASVLVSLGIDGAIYTNGTQGLYCKSMNVAVNSTVGAGDAMLAAACVAIKEGVSCKELLRMSVSAGTAAVTTSGSNLFYKDKYDEVYKNLVVENI